MTTGISPQSQPHAAQGGALTEDYQAPGDFRAGSLVAGYRIESRIGAGGMAVVFRASDERLGRLVALKVLAPQWAADAEFRHRFVAESRAAAMVDDPHVIPIYEAGDTGGVLFIAMRFVVGGDLRDVLRREGPLRPDRAAGFLSPVASALDAAHRVGLVHRDVKPANVLVDHQEGRPDHVYLSDFGVSKNAAAGSTLTGTGQFVGTPHFAAPEQIRGQAVDGRTDQYALACVAWQLLTGSVPFERDEPMMVLLAHLSEPPPSLAALRPELSAAGQVLARGLAKAPEDRYASCLDFVDALRDALGVPPYAQAGTAPYAPGDTSPWPGLAVTPAPAPAPASAPGLATMTAGAPGKPSANGITQPARQPRRALTITLAVTAAAVAAATVTVSVLLTGANNENGTAGKSNTTASTQAWKPAGTVTDPGSKGVGATAYTPDGATLAAADDNGHIYLWNTKTGKLTRSAINPGDEAKAMTFDSGNINLYIADSNGCIYIWNTATSEVSLMETLPSIKRVDSMAFETGSGSLAVGNMDTGQIYLWNIWTDRVTGTLRQPSAEAGVMGMAYGPFGDTLAVSDLYNTIYLWNLKTQAITATLHVPAGNLGAMAYELDDSTLASADLGDMVRLWNTKTQTRIATFSGPTSNDVESVATWDVVSIAIGYRNGQIYLWANTASPSS
jgi:serine/threonine-protein kinase